jgi:proteasome lid subunit RPN8/RPN11
MIAHCKEEYPNEACGILAGRDMIVSALYPMTNIEPSPISFLMDPAEQFGVMKELRNKSLSMAAIYHSHPCSPACPSARDKELAFYEDVVYIMVSLAEIEPVIKGFLIKEGEVSGIEIAVVP